MRRAGSALVAATSAALAFWLAVNHPLSPLLAVLGVVGLAALTAVRPAHWPLWLLPLLPLLGLMTWSGWLIVEEFDMALLAVAAGGWLRLAGGWPGGAPRTRSLAKVLWWFAPLVLSTVVSACVGMADAGGLVWGWWQGYREPLNSLRLAKPIFEVLLLLPLWLAACRADAPAATRRLAVALQAVLVGVAVWVVWERLAFTGLLDFSTDYRATGPFWEMHIGGAGLDAVLALGMPFAVATLLATRTPLRWALAAGVLVLGLYACLVTFSRIVYGAVPLGLLLWLALHALQKGPTQMFRGLRDALPWLAGFAVLGAWAFPASGYRGLLALLGAVALLLPVAPLLRGLQPSGRWQGAAIALVAGLCMAAASWLPKGAYIATALAWAVGAVALGTAAFGAARSQPAVAPTLVAMAALGAALGGVVAVAVTWGGVPALWPAACAVLVLVAVAVAAACGRRPLWPQAWRWQAQLVGTLVAVGGVVAVFGGGAYMGERMATSSEDGQGRQAHWRRTIGLLQGSDWLWGKGLGRYWAVQVQTGRDEDQTGDYRLLPPGSGHNGGAVVLTSGKHDLGSAEALRLSQRVAAPAPGVTVLKLQVRAEAAAQLDAEVCAKHLLYPTDCQGSRVGIPARPGVWQSVEVRLKGAAPTAGAFYAPRLMSFAISLGNHATRIEMDNIQLVDAQGQALLRNGDFEQGLAHWYFSSDRYHMPFHAKNMVVHLLFEQGLLGLGAMALLFGAALWRCSVGAARRHPLAPVLAGALMALLAVGLVDSIMDMPRVAFLTLLLLAVALALPREPGARRARHLGADPRPKTRPGP